MNKCLYAAGLALLAFASCSKSDNAPKEGLPPITERGAETLGFEWNGSIWVPGGQQCGIYGCYDNKVEAIAFKTRSGKALSFQLSANYNSARRNEAFILTIDSLTGPGVYQAKVVRQGPAGPVVANQLYFADNERQATYQSLQDAATTITISKVDTVNWIVAGTFEGQLQSFSPVGNPAMLKNGRFDVLYNR